VTLAGSPDILRGVDCCWKQAGPYDWAEIEPEYGETGCGSRKRRSPTLQPEKVRRLSDIVFDGITGRCVRTGVAQTEYPDTGWLNLMLHQLL
jgi:hypothetical protein